MPNHEHFRELSALAAIGQLSFEEDRELNAHLGECEECRSAHNDYARVVVHELPLADAVRSRRRLEMRSPLPDSELRDRFLARAGAEGIDFSTEAQSHRHPESARFAWRIHWRPALPVAAVIILGIVSGDLARRYQLTSRSDPAASGGTELMRENQTLRAKLAALRADVDRDATDLEKAKHENKISEDSLKLMEKRLAESQAQADRFLAQVQGLEATQRGLQADNQQKGELISDLTTKNGQLHRDNADNLSARIILESQIRDLKESLQQQTANVEREHQLMAVSKDVRQLISARNLHILDVRDVDGGGKDAKAFGRVFYAEGQALIFYAFDLPSGKLSPAKYTFEAWGQKEYVEHSVRSLGTFEVDDHDQRRWVLKVTDSALLRGIDSVFVTAEALGDAKAPRGRKLLYAYIVGEPNHP